MLLHGLGRSERAMRPLAKRLEGAGYAVHALGYESTEKSPDALVADLDAELARCCADAPRLHFVDAFARRHPAAGRAGPADACRSSAAS